MINAFDSSALESVAIDDGQVLVTFNGGRTYTYTVADVERFVTAFNAAESKGRFLIKQIKQETLKSVVTV